MSVLKQEIFLASRFEEFKEIRNLLKNKIEESYKFVEVIDLNNNEASYRTPLDESLFYVRKSDIVLLFVGETYGTIPEGEEYSYTHLEYKEAIKESSNSRVLVFCIGDAYKSHIDYSDNKNLKSWQLELEKNHRLKKFTSENSTDEIVNKIYNDLLNSLFELKLVPFIVVNDEDELESIENEILSNDNIDTAIDNDVLFLENKHEEDEKIDLLTNNNAKNIKEFDLLRIPNMLASIEQKNEAQYAIELRDYYSAMKHLRNALDLKPLDFESNYWLAKLYITSAKKSLFYEIEEYLLRAAKIAEKNNNLFRASHCYLLIVSASIFSEKKNEGLKYIELAENITPFFSKVYYEKTKFMLFF